MNGLFLALGLLLLSGLFHTFSEHRAVRRFHVGCVWVSALIGLTACGMVIGTGRPLAFHAAWPAPFVSLSLLLDPLSAFFMIPLWLIGSLTALYGLDYMQAYAGLKRAGPSAFWFSLLLASMVLVLLARQAVVFLFAWEVMAVSSFCLIMLEGEKDEVVQAGWSYLMASQVGAVFLLFLFLALGRMSGGLEFISFSTGAPVAGLVFLLALVGFGTKAGLVPLHVWLPEAHPAAPSPISALMSGVMIKMGIYGLLRILNVSPFWPVWCGWVLLGVGAATGLFGALFALAQHDLKRLLAYSSIENIGIVTLGLGVGMLGVGQGSTTAAYLGFAGALLHMLNHACFKSLLFLGAGVVAHAAHTREMDRLGGLLKKMPVTGMTFLVGSLSASGVPPFGGFVSEFLIYLAAFQLVMAGAVPAVLGGGVAILSLALIGGLVLAAFCKAFGTVFLGHARTDAGDGAHDPGRGMKWPLLILSGMCLLNGLLAPLMIWLTDAALAGIRMAPEPGEYLAVTINALCAITLIFGLLLAAVAGLVLLRDRLIRNRVKQTVTWDCGYAAPPSRAQYTGSSLVDPLISLFAPLLGTRRKGGTPKDLFPGIVDVSSESPDLFGARVWRPLMDRLSNGMSGFRLLQRGNVQIYVLYIAVTLLILLVWRMGV